MNKSTLLQAGPIARASLADSVYETILEAILSGTLAAGAELSEVAIAAELAVSRTPVHEAMLQLAADGLVEHVNNRQARVVQFSRDDIDEVYGMRLLLEPAAAERAAKRLSDEEIAELREAAASLADTRGGRGWTGRALEFDVRFHAALAAASGSRRLHAEITKYRQLVRSFCRATGTPENLESAMREHQIILDAIVRRDAGAARKAMAAHIDARREAVLAEFDQASAKS